MNWLAHSLLSKRHIDYQLGNILADPLRGAAWPDASEAMKAGMLMHKSIDKFTDQHPAITASKARLGQDGHLKGVVLDLLYDHFLSQHWSTFSRIELATFLRLFNQQAVITAQDFPTRAKTIVSRMASTNLLGQYQSFADLVLALERIDQRLSARAKAKETATQYIPALQQQYDHLETDFIEFFPELVAHFKQHKLGSLKDHYLI